MPRISVIMPVWNAAATLERAVKSIVGQGFSDWELVAVDDGSTDGSRDILAQWAERDLRIRVHHLDGHHGVVVAHEWGLRMASGELIARMDGDDWSDPRRFGEQVAMLDGDSGLGVVACGVRLLDPLGAGMERYVAWVNGLVSPEEISRQRFIESPIIHPSSMIRRAWVERVGGYRAAGWPEDYDLWLRMLAADCRMAKVEEVMFGWQDGPGRLTRAHPDYVESAVWRMKAHHLMRLPGLRGRGVAICGGGPIGRRLTGLLQAGGVEVRAIFDVDPAKIGRRLRGVEVLGADRCGIQARDAVLLSAVGVDGGRKRVRELARSAGYREGVDFWCMC